MSRMACLDNATRHFVGVQNRVNHLVAHSTADTSHLGDHIPALPDGEDRNSHDCQGDQK